jgi:hypothetical protein
MDNVIHLNQNQPNEEVSNVVGSDVVTNAKMYLDRTLGECRKHKHQIVFWAVLLIIASVADWCLLYQVLIATFQNEMGEIAEEQLMLLRIAATITILAFTGIGFLSFLVDSKLGKIAALIVYICIVGTVTLGLMEYLPKIGAFLKDPTGFANNEDALSGWLLFLLKRLGLLGVGILYTMAGVVVLFAEHGISKNWHALHDVKRNRDEASARVADYEAEQIRLEQDRHNGLAAEYLSDENKVRLAAKRIKQQALYEYLAALQRELEGLEKPHILLSRKTQSQLQQKRQQLELLIQSAEVLTI